MTPEERQARALDLLRQRKAAYQLTFGNAQATDVLDDLKRFCRARTSCFHSDPRIHAALEGRREVWQRIADYLELEVDELAERYGAIAPITGDRDDE